MTTHISSMNGVISAFRRPHQLLDDPLNKIELLKHPTIYKSGVEPLGNSYLEGLIQENIIGKNDGSIHGMLTAQIDACNARALYNSFDDCGKKKFEAVLESFHIAITKDKDHERNRKMLEEIMEMYQGGEIRVVAETGFRAIMKVLLDLLRVKPKHFYGVSAGGFQAAGRAFGAPNCIAIANTASTDYSEITKSRKHLERWINDLVKEAYLFTTGKNENEIEGGIIRVKHLEEMDTNLQVLVGEVIWSKLSSLFPIPTPHMESFFLPQEAKNRFGIDSKKTSELPLAPIVASSANLFGLFFLIDIFTFGRCFLKDSKGANHYLLDPGLDIVNGIPLQALEPGIKEYVDGKREYPPFAMIGGNKRVESAEKDLYSRVADFVDSHGTDPIKKMEALGVRTSYIEAFCAVEDPFIKGNTSLIRTGHLKMSTHDKEVVIGANIPTSNFTDFRFQGLELKPALYQIYDNLVCLDNRGIEAYIKSEGKEGRSPLQIYIDGVDKIKLKPEIICEKIRLPDINRVILEAKRH